MNVKTINRKEGKNEREREEHTYQVQTIANQLVLHILNICILL